MENVFVKGICQIGVFMICAQTFVHFCPKGAYEKYLKMLVSIMILVQILSPLSAILGGKGQDIGNATMGDWLEEVLMQSMDEVLQEGSFQLESIEESLDSDAWQIDGSEVVKKDGMENDAESKNVENIWQNCIQENETTSDSIKQTTGNIYIEPIAPIRVGQ